MPILNVASPVGPLTIEEQNGAIIRLGWDDASDDSSTPLLREAANQIDAYFREQRTQFNLPLKPQGSAFQKRVWSAMSEIPYGETCTYGDLAVRVQSAARAIGGACGTNPIPVIIPCHRVVAANGGAGGYSGKGGLRTKSILLDLENRITRLL